MNETKEFKSVFKKQLTAFYHDHRATRGTSVSLLENPIYLTIIWFG